VNQKIMHINRHTYEEFFLLYADNELDPTEKISVEEFVQQNPDLAEEFNLILETVIQPDESIFFENKELLLKEEEDRRVIPMRWFRFAVAAILLIAFSVTGWVFFGERKNNPPIVLNNKQVPIIVNKQPSSEAGKPSNEVKSGVSSGKVGAEAEPGTLKSTKNYARNFKGNFIQRDEDSRPQVQEIKEDVAPRTNETVTVPNHATITQDVVTAVPEKEIIDIPVSPREVERKENEPEPNTAVYAQTFEQQDNNNDLIYFANTSLTKKTKLRVVLRKATRYLDRVTSIQ
jgi:hypothetical protein